MKNPVNLLYFFSKSISYESIREQIKKPKKEEK